MTRLNGNKATKVHSFLSERQRRQRNFVVDPSDPAARGDGARGGFDPESRRPGPDRAAQHRERAFRKAVPQQIAIEIFVAGRQALVSFDLLGRTKLVAQKIFQLFDPKIGGRGGHDDTLCRRRASAFELRTTRSPHLACANPATWRGSGLHDPKIYLDDRTALASGRAGLT